MARDYTGTAKALHWSIALMVLALALLGVVMKRAGLPLGQRFALYQLHKSIGFTLLVLMMVRLAWRATHAPPHLPLEHAALTRAMAHIVHVALYALLIALPLTGWMMVSASAFPVPTRFFDWVTIPHLGPIATLPGETRLAWEESLKLVHTATALLLVVLAAAHAGAALWHHFVLRDGILRRMLPRRRRMLYGGAGLLLTLMALMATSGTGDARADGPRWKVDGALSRLTFEARAGGQPIKGSFKRFEAVIHLDPAAPEKATVEVEIATGSVDTGTRDIDGALVERDWFDAKAHPVATYRATGAMRLADGRIALDGRLRLKGKEATSILTITLEVAGTRAIADGEVIVRRSTFDVGPAGAVAGMVVENEVRIRVQIVAERTD